MADLTSRPGPATTGREKRRRIALLRGMLLFAVGALLFSSTTTSGAAAVALLLVFTASNVALLFVPPRLAADHRFELSVGALDLGLVALGIHLAGGTGGALPITCLLMVMVVALGNYRAHTVAGAAVVGALHAWLVVGRGTGFDVARQLAIQILFLLSVALYYGFLASEIHWFRRRREAEQLGRRELTTLLEILDAATSSLDLRQVAAIIVDRMSRVVPAERCSMLLVNRSKTRCFVMASHDNPDLAMLEIDLERYPEIRRAIETRDPVLVQDVAHDPVMREVRKHLESVDVQSIMVVPLTFADDVLGTLCLKTSRSSAEFSERETHFTEAVARASANALKNALLHRQVRDESARHRRTGAELSSILEHSSDLIVTTDVGGYITRFNRSAERLLGWRREEILGEPSTGLLVNDADADLVERVCGQGSIADHACRMRHREGGELDMELNMSTLEDEAGETTGTVWMGRDVTELKNAQRQLLQAEKLSTIGEVISGVAHELNNPLSGVLGFSQLLLVRHGDEPLARELEKIYESAQRCHKIVKNLLSFARGHKPEKKHLGVNGIVEKTLDLRKYQLHVNNIEVECELDRELPSTLLDFHQMQQVFLNLINNAQQAMATIRDRPGRLVVRSYVDSGMIRVEIGDNGEGMDTATRERIFDPFYTTKEQGQGTGLGLSVSYGIVKEHGGRIDVQSRPGVGTTFTVSLPVRRRAALQEETRDQAARLESAETPGQGRRILVVDDEPVILDLLIEVLDRDGYATDTAANGDEACQKVRSNAYDAVITDIKMPRMNGMDLYREILSARPELEQRVIFITGDLIDRDVVRFLGETNAITIPKPLDLPKVMHAVEQALSDAVAS